MRLAAHSPLRNLLGGLAIVLVLVALAFGLPALDRAIPAQRPVVEGRPYPVGAGVSVVPPPGALLDVTQTRPRSDRGTVLFVVGPLRYVVVVAPAQGDLHTAAARLRRKITDVRGYQVIGAESPVFTTEGLAGLQGGYAAPGRAGRYAVFLAAGLSIEITVNGGHLELGPSLSVIEASTRSVSLRRPR